MTSSQIRKLRVCVTCVLILDIVSMLNYVSCQRPIFQHLAVRHVDSHINDLAKIT